MKISAGSSILDELLDGGLESQVITTLYGAAGSGKSNIAMLAALDVASGGEKVIFIDTEGSFSIDRVKQITGDLPEIALKNHFCRHHRPLSIPEISYR